MKIMNEANYLFFLLSLFLLFRAIKANKNSTLMYRCGEDNFKPIPLSKENIELYNETHPNPRKKRVLDNTGEIVFDRFNIYLDLRNFYNEVITYDLNSTREMYESAMNKSVKTLETLLKSRYIEQNIKISDEQIMDISINNWDERMVGTTSPGMNELGIDLIIFVRFGDSQELGEGTLATAGPRYVHHQTGQPVVGVVNINKDINYTKANSFQYLERIMIHEFTHILGFSSSHLHTYFNGIFYKIDMYGKNRTYINSPKVLATARKYFNCDSIDGVELQEYNDTGTAGSHWESRILLGDYMNGIVFTPEQVISEFTLALLEDTGYYQPNYYTGGLMQYGKNKGCDFVNEKCSINKNNPSFSNEFYSSSNDMSCSSNRESRAYHIGSFNAFSQKHYENILSGQWIPVDNCQVSAEDSTEGENIYYVGHCSLMGISGEYGSRSNSKSSEMKDKTQEDYSSNSFCVLSSLISKTVDNYNVYSSTFRAVCYKMHCSDKSLTIQINNDFIVCPREGGNIDAINYDGKLACPDYNLICAGTVLCNDLFDCVEKKSLLKDNIIYDYEVKTTQNLNSIRTESISTNAYELSENGKCPIYCVQCDQLGNCKKCKSDYQIVELKVNGVPKRECELTSELTDGYLYNSIYYKCIDGCSQCVNDYECITCKSDYFKNEINNKCYFTVEHCISYDDNDMKCKTCETGYKVEKSENICVFSVDNCLIIDNVSGLCNQCNDDYILKDDEKNVCYLREELMNDKRYYSVDTFHMRTCSKTIENCEECLKNGDDIKCTKCQNYHYFIDEDYYHCYKDELIEENIYFYDGEKGEYYTCKNYNNIQNCLECTNKNRCIKCKEGYTFINDNKAICIQITELGNEYYHDLDDPTIYRKCSESINNCATCESKDKCLSCADSHGLYYDKTKCVDINDHKYFQKTSDNLYYLCNNHLDYCAECSSETECTACISYNHYLQNKKCTTKIEHCASYDDNENCLSCTKGYKLDAINNICVIGIENCLEVNGYGNCEKCNDSYVIKDDELDVCYLKAELPYNETYYYENKLHIRTCSKMIDNCEQCFHYYGQINCTKCANDTYFVDEDYHHCIEKENIDDNTHFYDSIKNEYYSCEKYNNISFCSECDNNSTCIRCKEEYTFITEEKDECVPIADLGYFYYQDSNDTTLYKECNESIINCKTCISEDKCLLCHNFYELYYNQSKCVNISENKYYRNTTDGLYYDCNNTIDKCIQCTSESQCITCQSGYHPINGICLIKVDHCRLYNSDGKCLNCTKGYKVSNTENICIIAINNCIEVNERGQCKKCSNAYILKEYEYDKCYLKADFANNQSYYEDDYHLKLCSKLYQNCEKCVKGDDDDVKCIQCKKSNNISYYFVDEDYHHCVKKEDIEDIYHFYDEDKGEYFSCAKYNHIQNCAKCNNSNSCNLCQEGFTFISDVRDSCRNITELGNHYIKDLTDPTIYRKCSEHIDNCETCSSETICLSCLNSYGLYKDKTKCVSVTDNKYFEKTINHLYYLCSDGISNCVECSSESECTKCISDDYVVKYNKCILKIPLCVDYIINGRCIQCSPGYKVDDRENKCVIAIDHCTEIDDDGNCITCEENYRLANNLCNALIINCASYEEDEKCHQCKSGFAFEEDNKMECKNKTLFEEGSYYTKDGGISYYRCDGTGEGRIQNCKICEYKTSDNELICNECNQDYVLKDDEDNICYSKRQFENDKKYYYEDSLHIKTCSKNKDKCEECENNSGTLTCQKCIDNYFFVNGDYDNCIPKNEITPIDEYYYDEQVYGYFLCLTYNSISDCKKCNNSNTCYLCKDGYSFINNEKNSCNKIEDLGDQYFIDENDNTIYRRCSEYMDNCDTCSSKNVCLTCMDGFDLYKDNSKCVNVTDQKYIKKDDNLYYLCSEIINNCNECSDETVCLNCLSGYGLENGVCVGVIRNCETYDADRKCTQCSRGYKIVDDGNNCKTEIDNCERLDDDLRCVECEDGYRLSNNICYKKVNNCEIYEEDEKCQKCTNGYAFEGNNRLICKNINEFEEYFTSNDISYFRCNDILNGGINQCKICEFNNDNVLICQECKTDYVLKDDEHNNCYSKELFINDKRYYYEDSMNIRTCSKAIEKCEQCEKTEDNLFCLKCINDYYLLNEDNLNCKTESEISELISLDEYYLDGINNHYYACNNIQYNSIPNCKKCDSKDSCTLCQDGYTFIDNVKTSCVKIEDLGNDYIQDENDPLMYRKCSYYIPQCSACSSKDICLSCLHEYGIYKDKTKCIYAHDDKYFRNPHDDQYYLCSDGIENCQKCSSNTECNICVDGYIRIDNDKSSCHLMNEIYVDEYYVDPNDNNMYIKCSSYIENCLQCEYEKGCKYCKYGYIMLNGDSKTCHKKSKVSLDNYFTEDEFMYYSCDLEKYKSNIHCFSIIPRQEIILTFLEAQKKTYKLYCYMMTHSPLPKDFSLKLTINIYNSKTLRNLEETQIILTTSDESDGSANKIITFVSEDLRSELRRSDDNIQIEDIKFNYDNPTTKTVTENNFCSLKFNKNSDLMDTGKVRSMIQAKKIPDCSKIKQSEIISLTMDKIDGCKFNLNSAKEVSFSSDNIDIEFVSSDEKADTITAKCDTKEDGINIIQCKLKDDANKKFSLKNSIVSDNNNFVIISTADDKDEFPILCEDNKKRNIIIVVSVLCSVAVVAGVVVIIYFVYKRKKEKKAKHEFEHTHKNAKRNSIFKRKLSYKPTAERLETGQFLSINTKSRKSKCDDETMSRHKNKHITKKTVISNK